MTRKYGHALLKWPPLAAKVERYGHYVLPVVLVAIGLEILSGFSAIETGQRSCVPMDLLIAFHAVVLGVVEGLTVR